MVPPDRWGGGSGAAAFPQVWPRPLRRSTLLANRSVLGAHLGARPRRQYDVGVITFEQALGIVLASIVIIIVPGPSVMFIVGRALSNGLRNALASIAGNSLGCYLVGVAVAFGLGPLFERYELLLVIVKWAGIAFLLWLGIQAFRHAGPIEGVDDTADDDKTAGTPSKRKRESTWGAIRTGIVVGVTNPKSLVVFTAIVPQFIIPGAVSTTVQILLLGLAPILVGLVSDTVWALAAGQARGWLAKSPRRMTMLGRIGGVSIIGVGVAMAVSGDGH